MRPRRTGGLDSPRQSRAAGELIVPDCKADADRSSGRWAAMLGLAALLGGCALPPASPGPMAAAPALTRPESPIDPMLAAQVAGTVATLRVGGPGCQATGAAVHLGGAAFVTVSHLVDGTQPMLRRCEVGAVSPRLAWQGQEGPAVVQRTGLAEVEPGVGLRYIGGQDIALLRRQGIRAGAPGARLCPADPVPGQPVLVATGQRVEASHILGMMLEVTRAYGGYVELPLVLEPGESGGGVFDATSGCLLGLVSHREAVAGEERTRIVSTAVLRRFVAQAEARPWGLAQAGPRDAAPAMAATSPETVSGAGQATLPSPAAAAP